MTDDITGFERYVREEYGEDFEEFEEFELPTVWVVCPACRGKGTSSAYLGAFTRDDFDEDPDFADDYLAGFYDRDCERCGGRTTVREIDMRRITEMDPLPGSTMLNLYGDFIGYCREIAEMYAIEAQERRMGA